MNRGIATALTAIVAAQALKLPIHYARKGEWDWKRTLGTGGMPSSHSSGVAALAAYTAARHGMTSIEFAIAAMLGMIVMYDAAGIRRHAGEIAIQVNDLDADVERLAGEHPGVYHERRKERLKETLGHQPEEVLGGAVLGAAIGLASAFAAKA